MPLAAAMQALGAALVWALVSWPTPLAGTNSWTLAMLGLILLAYAAAGMAALSPVYWIYVAFIVPMMGLWTLYFAQSGELPDAMVAILSASYTILLLFTARQQNGTLTRSLTLNHENRDLIADLKDEIDVRIRMAEALQRARDDEEVARVEAERPITPRASSCRP